MIAKFIRATRNRLHRSKARTAYRTAYAAHWQAVERCDTRRIGETRQALLKAQTERLRIGA